MFEIRKWYDKRWRNVKFKARFRCVVIWLVCQFTEQETFQAFWRTEHKIIKAIRAPALNECPNYEAALYHQCVTHCGLTRTGEDKIGFPGMIINSKALICYEGALSNCSGWQHKVCLARTSDSLKLAFNWNDNGKWLFKSDRERENLYNKDNSSFSIQQLRKKKQSTKQPNKPHNNKKQQTEVPDF